MRRDTTAPAPNRAELRAEVCRQGQLWKECVHDPEIQASIGLLPKAQVLGVLSPPGGGGHSRSQEAKVGSPSLLPPASFGSHLPAPRTSSLSSLCWRLLSAGAFREASGLQSGWGHQVVHEDGGPLRLCWNLGDMGLVDWTVDSKVGWQV